MTTRFPSGETASATGLLKRTSAPVPSTHLSSISISHNALIKWFKKVNSFKKSSTYRILSVIESGDDDALPVRRYRECHGVVEAHFRPCPVHAPVGLGFKALGLKVQGSGLTVSLLFMVHEPLSTPTPSATAPSTHLPERQSSSLTT